MTADRKPLIVTPGEPAGVGPDVVLAAAAHDRGRPWIVIADPDLLATRARLLGLPIDLDENLDAPSVSGGRLTVRAVPLAAVEPGIPDPRNAPALLSALDEAVDACLAGRAAGLVTGPLQKSAITAAGFPFTGHTEYLCRRAGVEDVVMLLASGGLRVALATTHLPLAAVPEAITRQLLLRRIRILHDGLRTAFSIVRPRIVVTGLNPHAGEAGTLGREEIEVIAPAIQAMRDEAIDVQGPVPADSAFTPGALRGVDAVLVMYHDQGLPVLKHAGFGHAVNVTLGLPFVRTSVDHGTALDVAGTGRADPGSFLAAAAMAEELTGRVAV